MTGRLPPARPVPRALHVCRHWSPQGPGGWAPRLLSAEKLHKQVYRPADTEPGEPPADPPPGFRDPRQSACGELEVAARGSPIARDRLFL